MHSRVGKEQGTDSWPLQAPLPNRNTETPLSANYSTTSPQNNGAESKESAIRRSLASFLPLQAPFLSQILVLCCLGLAALVPRTILANQLDLTTDEIIYILAGKSYMPLLRHITTTIGTSGWQFNYEHPPLVKFFIGLSILGNDHAGHPFSELVAARIPSIIAGIALIMLIYWLGRKPFGQLVAFLAALSLAFSPWVVYFSSIAYLDMTMTTFLTTAYLLTWYATRRPWLYACVALFVALGIDSKYTAALIIPGILLFTAYYFFVLRLRLPALHRLPAFPWLWWLIAAILTPLYFFALDPVIWSHPLHTFVHSLLYEWEHSVGGHLTFLAGSYSLHVPRWTVLYIIVNKISAFVTVPAALFAIIALIHLIRFHLPVGKSLAPNTIHSRRPVAQDGSTQGGSAQGTIPTGLPTAGSAQDTTTTAFLLIWLLTTVGMFSLLNIVVGTHYLLPLAPPIVIAGTYTLVYLTRKISFQSVSIMVGKGLAPISASLSVSLRGDGDRRLTLKLAPMGSFLVSTIPLFLIGVILVGPHLLGLLNTAGAEGYTSEFFHGENETLQVAYAGYLEAVQWLDTHTQGEKRIGLVALPQTLERGDQNVSWFAYNSNLPKRFHIQEVHPKDSSYSYDYLVWPMHLIQRGNLLPQSWHIIHTITGGDTTYCYIATAPPP